MAIHVAVIGGGILGVSAAYHLVKLGGCTVSLIERHSEPARCASGRGAGMVRHLYEHPRLTEWAQRSVLSWPQGIREELFQRTGSIIVARSIPNHHQELFQSITFALPPYSACQDLPAVFTPGDGLLEPRRFTLALYRHAIAEGVVPVVGEKVEAVDFANGQWHIRTSCGTHLTAAWIVNATGAWLNDFLRRGSSPVPCDTHAYARHLFTIAGFPEDSLPLPESGFYWDEAEGWYLRRWNHASRLFSLCDEQPADPDTFERDDRINVALSEQLKRNFPEIAERLHITNSWYCFRTYTQDRLPVWGPDEQFPSFFWLGGFGGYGISTGYAAAEDAAHFIAGRNVDIPEEFLPRRAKKTSPQTPESFS